MIIHPRRSPAVEHQSSAESSERYPTVAREREMEMEDEKMRKEREEGGKWISLQVELK